MNIWEQKINNIKRLYSFIEDAYLSNEDEKWTHLNTDYTVFSVQLNAIYQEWFPQAKNYSDYDISCQIYKERIEEKDFKTWIKFEFNTILKCSERIFENIKKYKETQNNDLMLSELQLLNEFSFEVTAFLSWAISIVEGTKIKNGSWRRFYWRPIESYGASQMLLRKKINKRQRGDFGSHAISIFLLRQSIELVMLNAFGIRYATDQKGNYLKIQPERLFDLIDVNKKNNDFPVEKSIIEKIHTWTQPFVHAGHLWYIWEIEWAQYVLRPLFEMGNIKIKKDFYLDMQNQLRILFKKEDLILHQEENPEASTLI